MGDIVTPSDSDFITLSVPAMGTDFHAKWRNADGTLNTGGFAETTGTYKSLGYHFTNMTPSTPVTTQQEQPVVTTQTTSVNTSITTSEAATTTTTPLPVAVGLAGDANGNGTVDMSDAVLIMQSLANPSKFSIPEKGRVLADAYKPGTGVTNQDALSIQKYLLGLIPSLPEN